MNVIRYGPCWLNVIKVNSYKRAAVYNGPDYLYTRHVISVRAVFNPAVQHEFLRGDKITYGRTDIGLTSPRIIRDPVVGPLESEFNPPSGGTLRPDRPAAVTAEAIKHALLQPRLVLTWTIQGQQILHAPLPGYATDSTNGPKPIDCDVVELHSGKTWLVDYVIQADISECPRFTQKPSPVLSNQWEMFHDLDQDFYTVRVIRGKVIFDAAVVRGLVLAATDAIRPDDLRPLFLFPVPANMKRDKVRVHLEQDGVTLNYEVVDKETSLNISSAFVTRVEAVHTVQNTLPDLSVGMPSIPGLKVGVSLGSLGSLQHQHALARGGLHIGTWGLSKLGLPSWITDVTSSVFGAGQLVSLALSTHKIAVRAWGTRDSSRRDLQDFCRDLIRTRITPVRVAVGFPVDYKVAHDVAGTFVEVAAAYLAGPLLPGPSGTVSTSVLGGNVFPAANDTGNLLVKDSSRQTLRPPYDNVGRGTYLEALVAAALTKPCDKAMNLTPANPKAAPSAPALPTTKPSWPKPARP